MSVRSDLIIIVDMPEREESVELLIINSLGQVVGRRNFETEEKIELITSHLSPGAYYLMLSQGGASEAVQSFIISR